MSLISALNIGRQGLQIAQLGLQITAQNIANVNTQGYKRSRLEQANLPLGLGVTVRSITRVRDVLAENQLMGATLDFARAGTTAGVYTEMASLLNDITGHGLDEEFRNFFATLQDLTAQSGGAIERSAVRAQGASLGRTFEYLHTQLTQQMTNRESEVRSIVAQANALVDEIAQLNREIGQTSDVEGGANDLLNQREELVRQLAELVPVTTATDANGTFTVFLESGMPLVAGTQAFHLEAVANPDNDLKSDIFWVTDTGNRQNVTANITGSRLGAVLEARDVILPEQIAKLNRLAAEFVLLFNEQHRAGTGLDGTSGRNFFESPPVDVQAAAGNPGSATVEGAIVTDDSLLTLANYEIRFGAGTYEVFNVDTGASVQTGAYGADPTIAFHGIEVTFTGTPADGDVFAVNTVTDAAANIRIATDVADSLDAIAAGLTSATGDNENALLLANLENAPLAAGARLSVMEVYHAMIAELGSATAGAQLSAETQLASLMQTTNMVENVSGVNLDEEATLLMQYQYSYQAASKVISTTDEMLEVLLSIV